ncbi:iron-containing redox enzyme family protein [Glycomyces scopariae]
MKAHTALDRAGIEQVRAAVAPVRSRGPLSDALCSILSRPGPRPNPSQSIGHLPEAAREALASSGSVIEDEDLQLSLFLLYGSAYGSLRWIDASWEWHPDLIATRGLLEQAFEAHMRSAVSVEEVPQASREAVAAWLFTATAPGPGPSLARFVAKRASLEQAREFLIQRSIYTLREADPHSWAIPRLTGRSKAALVEIQSDEYGGGDPARVHAAIFARTMRGAGLDDRYGAYVDDVPALTLASQNMMSMFGLNRRLRGAIVGHLAAFEMTSSLPNRLYGDGFRRLGFGPEVTAYFDEHVEADAVHEQIAARDLAGALAEDEPALLDDILFGALACLRMDTWVGDRLLDAWQDGRTTLRRARTPGGE